MARKKAALKLNAYAIVSDAIENGLGFALNRLEDAGASITQEQRQAAMEPMLNEIMFALEAVVDWEKSS